jgi:hypothetical protein
MKMLLDNQNSRKQNQHNVGGGGGTKVLNQKVGLKPSETIDFASRFIIIIESTNLDAKSTAPEDFKPIFWFKSLCTYPALNVG